MDELWDRIDARISKLELQVSILGEGARKELDGLKEDIQRLEHRAEVRTTWAVTAVTGILLSVFGIIAGRIL